ncbi:YdcH family protein [Labrys neptuniae]
MPVESHLVELERKHHALETELTIALAHPSSDDLKIAELKRKKLLLKDEIARLKSTERLH